MGAGALTAVAFPPFGSVGAGAIGLLAGLWLWRRSATRLEAAARGLTFGLCLLGLLAWSSRFGAVAYVGLTVSQAAFPALAWALVGVSGFRPAGGGSLRRGVGLAELARSRWPLGGFELGQLGHAVGDLPLGAAAAAVGSLGLTGVVVALGAAAVSAVDVRGPLRSRLLPVAVAATLALAVTALGSVPWTRPGGAMTVGLVQRTAASGR